MPSRPRDPIPDLPTDLGPCQGLVYLGAGSMGAVYRARHVGLGRDVAVKVVNPRVGAADPKMFQRFLREVNLLRAIDHPHVIRVLDAGQVGRFVFAVLELVDGISLDAVRRQSRDGRLEPGAVAHYLQQVALGLEAVHRAGIVHRDLKPENVLVDAAGRARIADFGLARGQGSQQLTMMDEVVGTPEYMAPEMVQHAEVDGRADLYALGISAYELLTGATPFHTGGLLQVVRDQITRDPVPVRVMNPQVPDALAAVVHRLLEKDPARRPPSALAAAELLRPLAARPTPPRIEPRGLAPPADPDTTPPPQARPGAPPGASQSGAPRRPTGGWGAAAAAAPTPLATPRPQTSRLGQAPAAHDAPTEPRPSARHDQPTDPRSTSGRAAREPAPAPARPSGRVPTDAGPPPTWEEVLLVRLLARHGRAPLELLLEAVSGWRPGGPTLSATLTRKAGLPDPTPAQAAAQGGVRALRDQVAWGLLRRTSRVKDEQTEAVSRARRPDEPLSAALGRAGLLRPDEVAALERQLDEAVEGARQRAIQAAGPGADPARIARAMLQLLGG